MTTQGVGADVSACYTGGYQGAGATTAAARFAEVGQPGYISEVFDTAAIRYRFVTPSSEWLDGTSVRLGVVNLANPAPRTCGVALYRWRANTIDFR